MCCQKRIIPPLLYQYMDWGNEVMSHRADRVSLNTPTATILLPHSLYQPPRQRGQRSGSGAGNSQQAGSGSEPSGDPHRTHMVLLSRLKVSVGSIDPSGGSSSQQSVQLRVTDHICSHQIQMLTGQRGNSSPTQKIQSCTCWFKSTSGHSRNIKNCGNCFFFV